MVGVGLVACGEGSKQPGDAADRSVLRVPSRAIAALDSYRFTTQLDVRSAETDLHVTVDGAFAAPDRIQGIVTVRGEPYERYIVELLKRPATSEAIVIGDTAWWRAADGDWQPGIEGYETIDPFVTLRHYATPEFYLEALRFDELTLPVAGREEVSGVHAVRVRLDKHAIVGLLRQGTGIRLYPDPQDEHTSGVFPGVIDNTLQVLPDDFVVEVWFDEETKQPVRIVFDYRVTEDDEFANLSWGFGVPMELRLELDITDAGADVHIEPPAGFTLASPEPERTADVPVIMPIPAITRSP
jgi:hypothetical protein